MRFCCLALVCLSSSAFALSLDDVRSIVKGSSKSSYSVADHGYLCERIAVETIHEQDPSAEILNGVEYKKKGGRVIGELDLVVLHDDVVSEVIEVKCMKNFASASHKADEQLERFSHYLGHCDVDFSLGGEGVPCEAFSNSDIPLRKMSYADARSAGFDYDIGVTRKELIKLIEED